MNKDVPIPYKFCKSEGCNFLRISSISGNLYCGAGFGTNPYDPYITCPYSAKKVYEWLQDNGFRIIKNER